MKAYKIECDTCDSEELKYSILANISLLNPTMIFVIPFCLDFSSLYKILLLQPARFSRTYNYWSIFAHTSTMTKYMSRYGYTYLATEKALPNLFSFQLTLFHIFNFFFLLTFNFSHLCRIY